MNEQKRFLADKFFNNQCSSEEAEEVLEWLDTLEGEKYLNEKMDSDLSSANENIKEITGLDSLKSTKLNEEQTFRNILRKIAQFEAPALRRRTYLNPLLKVAAVLLVIATSSLFLHTHEIDKSESETERVIPDVFMTVSGEQRELTLRDGTIIHMNEHSRVSIPENYMQQNREILLEGEAYFEVAHNRDLPFIINTNDSEIEVLGTSFNVRSTPKKRLVEVTVVEGKVSFRGSREIDTERVILQKGDYGYLDTSSQKIKMEHFGAQNYLAWKSGEFIFDGLSLDRVCIQLYRFYEVTCRFNDKTIKERKLTANFPKDDLNNTLSVIALSLNLPYKTNEKEVLWLNNR